MTLEDIAGRETPAASAIKCPLRLICIDEVEAIVGLKKSKIYALVRVDAFPAPLRMGTSGRWSRWVLHECEAWIAARIAERDRERAA